MTDESFVWVLNQGWRLGGLVICILVVNKIMKRFVSRKYTYFLWWSLLISYGYLFLSDFFLIFPYYVRLNRFTQVFPFVEMDEELLHPLKVVWFLGVVVLLLYLLCSYSMFRRKLRQSAQLRENIFISPGLDVPFSMGILRPRIYLPSGLSEDYYEAVILHEEVHIARHDLLYKRIALLFLAINWFQPLAWLAYYMFVRDMEVACDEKVLVNKTASFRKNYAKALVDISTGAERVSPIITGYGSGEIEERIRFIRKCDVERSNGTLKKIGAVALCVGAILLCIPTFWYIPKLFMQKPVTGAHNEYKWEIITRDITEK